MMLAFNQAHQAPIFTDTYQAPFFSGDVLEPISSYPCGVTSPLSALSPVSPVTPTHSGLSGVSAPKTPSYPGRMTPTFQSFLFPRPDTPKMQMLDLLATNTPTKPVSFDLLRPKTPTLELSRPRTPTLSLEQYPRPLTPSAKAFNNLVPPQSRTVEVHHHEMSASEMCVEESDTTSYTASSMPLLYYISKMDEVDADAVIHQRGYQIIDKIRDCSQGSLWRAKVIKENIKNAPLGSIVAIKRVDKVLRQDGECIMTEDGFTEVSQEDVRKEGHIMKLCTVDIRASGRFILKYIDLFETQSEWCLVQEWHENALSIKEFADKAHEYIEKGLMSRKTYSKTIKYLFWQLLATLRWLHEGLGCCHLNLDVNTILLSDAEFEAQSDGMYKVSGKITIKLSDFSLAEIFDRPKEGGDPIFDCHKTGPSSPYVCPEMVEGAIYDARKADMFALGHILYYALVGSDLYDPYEMWDTPRGGWAAIQDNKLKDYLAETDSLKPYFKVHSFEVLRSLLTYDDEERPNAQEVMNCEWFRFYYKQYGKKLHHKINSDRGKLHHKLHVLSSPSMTMPLYSF